MGFNFDDLPTFVNFIIRFFEEKKSFDQFSSFYMKCFIVAEVGFISLGKLKDLVL